MLSRQSQGEPGRASMPPRHTVAARLDAGGSAPVTGPEQWADQLNVSGQRQAVRNHPHCAGQLLARGKHAAKNIVSVKNSEN